MTPIILALSVITGLAFMSGVWLLAIGGGEREELAIRSSELTLLTPREAYRSSFNEWVERSSLGTKLAVTLEAGGLPIGAADYLLATLVAGVSTTLLAMQILPTPFAIALGVLVVWVSWIYIKKKAAQRLERFIEQLADVARILSAAASAGLSVSAGMTIAGKELPAPAGTELMFLSERLMVGSTLEAATEELRDRLPSREVGILISTLVIQQRAGGDTVKSLADIAFVLEQRADTLSEVKTILSRSVYTTYMLPGLAIAVLLISDRYHEGNVRLIFSNLLFGILPMAVAVLLIGVGIAASRRLARVTDWDEEDEKDPEPAWDREMA